MIFLSYVIHSSFLNFSLLELCSTPHFFSSLPSSRLFSLKVKEIRDMLKTKQRLLNSKANATISSEMLNANWEDEACKRNILPQEITVSVHLISPIVNSCSYIVKCSLCLRHRAFYQSFYTQRKPT